MSKSGVPYLAKLGSSFSSTFGESLADSTAMAPVTNTRRDPKSSVPTTLVDPFASTSSPVAGSSPSSYTQEPTGRMVA